MQIEYTCTEFSCRIPFGCCVQRMSWESKSLSGQGNVIWVATPPLFWTMSAAVDKYGIELSVYCSIHLIYLGQPILLRNSSESMKTEQEQLLTLSIMALALEWDVSIPKYGLLLL